MTVLAIHLFDERRHEALLRKIEPLIRLADQVWISSASDRLLERAVHSRKLDGRSVRTFQVDSKWNDWSGYLAFLEALEPTVRMIACNDSLVTRRVIGGNTMRRFVGAVGSGQSALIGELDSAEYSVDVGGWSSASWVSTYLFSCMGLTIDVRQLTADVDGDVRDALDDSQHYFNRYLVERRPSTAVERDKRKAKLGAMFFERRLTRLAVEQGIEIVDFCAGSGVRKVERVLERWHDA